MTPIDLMQARRTRLRLVIFDCDGVIVDSEPVSNRILAEEISALGWVMDTQEATRLFLGVTLTDMVPMIEARTARSLPHDWRLRLTARIVTALEEEATEMPGAIAALRAVDALGVPWRVASNSSHSEMRVKFARIGITDIMAGRVHSHHRCRARQTRPRPVSGGRARRRRGAVGLRGGGGLAARRAGRDGCRHGLSRLRTAFGRGRVAGGGGGAVP